MQKSLITKLLPTLSVPLGLFLVLVPFSLLIKGNIAGMILFWFVITPALAEYLPKVVSKRKNLLAESLVGTVIFYAIIVFMIYKHYQTDVFSLIVTSCVFNMIVITVISRVKRVIADEEQHTDLVS